MSNQEHKDTNPEYILMLKDELLAHWQALPPEHQATMALVLLKDVLQTEYCDWLREAVFFTVFTEETTNQEGGESST